MRLLVVMLGIAACMVATGVQAKRLAPGDRDYYGPLTIRDERPVLIVQEPRIVRSRGPREPLYVRVPPGHAKQWEKHCAKYRACDRPVYFVDDRWYHEHYAGQGRGHRNAR